MLDKNVIWNVIVNENEHDNFYNINITGEKVVVSMVLSSFNNIDKYKQLAISSLKSYKYKNFKVV